METNSIDLIEINAVINDLFRNYLKRIKIKDAEWNLETISEQTPSISVKQLSNEKKTKIYAGGTYIAETPFAIVYRNEGKDSAAIEEASNILNRLGATFEKETKNNMENIEIEDTVPISIEMTGTPEKLDIENNVADFIATYTFTYKGGIIK